MQMSKLTVSPQAASQKDRSTTLPRLEEQGNLPQDQNQEDWLHQSPSLDRKTWQLTKEEQWTLHS